MIFGRQFGSSFVRWPGWMEGGEFLEGGVLSLLGFFGVLGFLYFLRFPEIHLMSKGLTRNVSLSTQEEGREE